MILSKKYDEVMERVYVTEDMHQRIVKNIENTDFKKKNNFYKCIVPLAACLVIAAVGALTVPKIIEKPSGNDIVQGTNQIIEVGSAAELSDMVGFEINVPQYIPFEAESVTYISLWNEIGEIDFENGDKTLSYRKGFVKDGEVSGDYNEYAAEKTVSFDNTDVTIKGTDGEYTLAVWTKGDYAYSVSISYGVSESEIMKVVESVE